MAMVMGYVEVKDKKLLKELRADNFQVIEVRTNPMSLSKVLMAKDFDDDVQAEDAASSKAEMHAVPGGSIDKVRSDSISYIANPGWSDTPVTTEQWKTFDEDDRKRYLSTLNKLRLVLVSHAIAWIVLAGVGTATLLITLTHTFHIVEDLLTDTSTTTSNGTSTTKTSNFDGWEVSLIIFTLAIFVVSPAVLLIVGRPLANLDAWMPGAKPEKPKASGDGGDTQTT